MTGMQMNSNERIPISICYPCLRQRSMAAVIVNPLMGFSCVVENLIKMNCNLTRLILIPLSHCIVVVASLKKRSIISGGGGVCKRHAETVHFNVHTRATIHPSAKQLKCGRWWLVSINYLHRDSHNNNVLGRSLTDMMGRVHGTLKVHRRRPSFPIE